MKPSKAATLGTEPIGKLLIRFSIPASIGILVMSLNIVVDTIFVGHWIGAVAIAAINVVLPVSFFIGALGMAIGVGGSSVISRALGAENKLKAQQTFGNQIMMTLSLSILLVALGLFFIETLIPGFGGKGGIYQPAKIYYQIVLYGVPFLALCMMGNTVIRAEGKPKHSMIAMIIPSVSNLLMDYVFIKIFGWGMAGAAWATSLSYVFCFSYIFWFFLSKNSELKIGFKNFLFSWPLVKEISSLGFVTLARQAVVSITYLVVNNILFHFGGETSVAVYGIVGRMLMFALFPILGVTQGFLPIAGFNYGAEKYPRVRESIVRAIVFASSLAVLLFILIMLFPDTIAQAFTTDSNVLKKAPYAIRWVFAATPIVGIQLIGAAYFQAIGKSVPALLLTLTRQGFFFIPLVLILPSLYGEKAVWFSYFIADLLATLITAYFLRKEILNTL